MNETNHPARRLRHGDRPTEPLTFDDAAANKAAEEGGLPALKFDVETRDELTDAQNHSLDNLRTLNELLICFSSWEPQVCVVGNVRAGDSVNAIRAAIAADRASRQVANKAEVEENEPLVSVGRDSDDSLTFTPLRDFYVTNGMQLFATPPATTGASTALADMEARKDAAYYERNQVVAALAKCFSSGVAKTAIEGWSEDWHSCVYIDLPTGQASWHFHDSQAHLFDGLPAYVGGWDGHSTDEKYARLAALKPVGASTVLTDERTSIDTPEMDRLLVSYSMAVRAGESAQLQHALLIAHINQHVAREVAAQAGQVAVPEDVRNAALDEAADLTEGCNKRATPYAIAVAIRQLKRKSK